MGDGHDGLGLLQIATMGYTAFSLSLPPECICCPWMTIRLMSEGKWGKINKVRLEDLIVPAKLLDASAAPASNN